MKSSQINFCFTEQDIADIETFLARNNFKIIGQPLPDKQLSAIQTLLSRENNIIAKKILATESSYSGINLTFVETQNYYLIDPRKNNVIEFIPTKIQDKKLKPGRLYYTKQYYNAAGEVVQKDPEFLATADKLFRWIRKTFKDAKLPGYEGLLVSPRAAAWAQETGGKLLVNN